MDSKLCYDMMIEILSRTSLKTLDSMRCTSKEFDTLTYDSYVVDMSKQRNNVVSGFLVHNMKSDGNFFNEFVPSPESKGLDLSFLPGNARIVATSEQGIIVLEIPDPTKHRNLLYHVCKPVIKEVLALPNPKIKYLTVKVSIVVIGSKPLHYKILRLSEHEKIRFLTRGGRRYNTYRCEVFDSKTWEWKGLALLMLPHDVSLTEPHPIITKGSIYMLLSNNDILKFDAYSENWTTFSSPVPTLEVEDECVNTSKQQLVKYEGKLGFACQPPNSCWEIWVRTTKESWEKIYVSNGKEDFERELPEALYGSDTSIMKDHNKLLFYKFKRGNSIKMVELRDVPNHQMFVFRSDFETIDLAGRPKPTDGDANSYTTNTCSL